MQETEQDTHAEKQLSRVRKALTVNPSAIVMILPDEAHRELAQAAFEKQHKNAVAAKGTMLALTKREDPTLDEIIESLSHLQQMAVNARPAEHQLDGTPIGRALEEQNGDGGKKQQRTRRGGEPQQVGQILEGVRWADEVPQPRPEAGQLIRLPNGLSTSITIVYGYMGKQNDLDAFDVRDAIDWRGLVYAHNGEWRLVAQQAEYTDAAEPEGEQEGTQAAPTPETASESNPEGTSEPSESEIDELRAADRADPANLDEGWGAGDVGIDSSAPDEVDAHHSMAGDLDEEEQERQNFSGSEDLVGVADEQPAKGGKKGAKKASRSKLQKGKRSGGKKR
jgi:uncharacterized protein YcgL (UPF0745 family)